MSNAALTADGPHPLASRIDWDAAADEAADLLARYIRIDTSHPVGRTAEAAAFFGAALSRAGIESRIYQTPAPGKVNLVARLRAEAAAGKPLLLSNHMDVVQAIPSEWSFGPYAGEVANGYVRGRGALDWKGGGVMELMALLQLKRLGARLTRDLLLLCTCDEEVGSGLGAQWMVDNYFADLDPGFVLDECGSGKRGFYSVGDVFEISVGEKRTVRIQMVARSESGHGSMPWEGAATHRLVRAASAILAQVPEERLSGPIEEAVRRLGGEPIRRDMAAKRGTRPLLRDTISLTMLGGGYKVNVIPEQAEMSFDCRLLPDTDERAFVSNVEQIVNDPSIRLEVEWPASPRTMAPWEGVGADAYVAIEHACTAYMPDAHVVPSLCIGATDARFFRARGIPAYGFLPCMMTADDLKGFHGVDERLSLENLRLGIQMMFDVTARLVAEA